ncbi:MAG: PPC domain-containing protein [Planctomycetota bacterium]
MFQALAIFGVITLALAATASRAVAEPVLNATSPLSFQRGTSTPIVFRGARMDEPDIRLLAYTEGITLTEWKSEEAKTGSAVLHVDAEVSPGMHAFRLVSARGMSALRTIYVGNLPTVAEVEPNEGADRAQPLPHDCTIWGQHAAGDEDWYAVEVGEDWRRLSIEVHGVRLGRRFVDPLIELYDPDNQRIAQCDDTPLTRQDPLIQLQAPRPGTYKIMIRDAMYRGGGGDHYLLHVGQFPRPDGVVPTGGPAGETLDVGWLYAGAEVDKQTLALPAEARGTIELFPEDDLGVAPSPIPFELGAAVAAESEPNNAHAKANPISWPLVVEATLGHDGDIDYFKFSANKGQVVRCAVR